jgi:exosortase/archaeosortase
MTLSLASRSAVNHIVRTIHLCDNKFLISHVMHKINTYGPTLRHSNYELTASDGIKLNTGLAAAVNSPSPRHIFALHVSVS